jgi:hypothetical protein
MSQLFFTSNLYDAIFIHNDLGMGKSKTVLAMHFSVFGIHMAVSFV